MKLSTWTTAPGDAELVWDQGEADRSLKRGSGRLSLATPKLRPAFALQTLSPEHTKPRIHGASQKQRCRPGQGPSARRRL